MGGGSKLILFLFEGGQKISFFLGGGPIFFLLLIFLFFFLSLSFSPKRIEGGGTNERPGTDHVTTGLMTGLEKITPDGTDRQTSRRTWQLYD